MPTNFPARIAVPVFAAALAVMSLSPGAAQTDARCSVATPEPPTVATPSAVAVAPTDTEAVLLALAIRQEQVVTTLEIVRTDDGALAGLASDELEQSRDHLAAITALLPADPADLADPAQIVAVIDRLRQERDLSADAAALTVWEPGLVEAVLCADGLRRGSDRDALAIVLVRDASLAIVDLTGLAEPLLPDEGELLEEVGDAAEARLDALATLPIAPATPVG